MPLTVKASEAREHFPSIAKYVNENKVEVTVIKGSSPYVKIVPIDEPPATGTNVSESNDKYLNAYLQAADEYYDLFELLSK